MLRRKTGDSSRPSQVRNNNNNAMIYNLIVDAGSTKADWVLTDSAGAELLRFQTRGVNAAVNSREEIEDFIREGASKTSIRGNKLCIYFYGAGCLSAHIVEGMEQRLRNAFDTESAVAASDLLGAARSICGHEPGIACILGTGSNSCLYDGKNIIRNTPSLGYILGDEGSGASLGKRLLADAYKGQLPDDILQEIEDTYDLTMPLLIENVYRRPSANRYLASFVPFIKAHLEYPEIDAMVRDEFNRFFTRNVINYDTTLSTPVGFVGSIAFHFADQVKAAAEMLGLQVGKIIQKPIESLVKFHSTEAL